MFTFFDHEMRDNNTPGEVYYFEYPFNRVFSECGFSLIDYFGNYADFKKLSLEELDEAFTEACYDFNRTYKKNYSIDELKNAIVEL